MSPHSGCRHCRQPQPRMTALPARTSLAGRTPPHALSAAPLRQGHCCRVARAPARARGWVRAPRSPRTARRAARCRRRRGGAPAEPPLSLHLGQRARCQHDRQRCSVGRVHCARVRLRRAGAQRRCSVNCWLTAAGVSCAKSKLKNQVMWLRCDIGPYSLQNNVKVDVGRRGGAPRGMLSRGEASFQRQRRGRPHKLAGASMITTHSMLDCRGEQRRGEGT